MRLPTDPKTCPSCRQPKTLADFYRNKARYDGRDSTCHECERTRRRERIRLNPRLREHRRDVLRKYTRSRYDAGLGIGPKPANRAVYRAVSSGKVVPPEKCERCGHDFSVFRREAHHPDYSRPLAVEWLCSACHGETRWI